MAASSEPHAEREDAEPDVLARQLSGAMTMEDTMAAYLLRTPRFFSRSVHLHDPAAPALSCDFRVLHPTRGPVLPIATLSRCYAVLA